MRLFLTGGTGFIGSYFLNQALAAGHEVVALRRKTSNSSRGVTLLKEPVWLEKEMRDLTVRDLAGCSALVHLAASGATPQPATWQGCFQFNVVDALYLAELAQKAGLRRIVAAGSYAEYGKSGLRYDFIPCNAPLEPTDPYAASKAALSIALSAFAQRTGMELVYGRVFSAFGEGQYEKNLWPSLKKAAETGQDFPMTKGEQMRDFIKVETIADWFLKSLDRALAENSKILVENVASGIPTTLADFCSYWWKAFGATGRLQIGELPYRDGEVMRYVPQVK